MAIAPMIIGSFSVIVIMLSLSGSAFGLYILPASEGMSAFPLGIVGLVLGIYSLRKEKRRKTAIGAIAINTLAALYPLAIVFLWGILGD